VPPNGFCPGPSSGDSNPTFNLTPMTRVLKTFKMVRRRRDHRCEAADWGFDVVAAAEGKLIYLELKSSPPKNIMVAEVTAFFDRFLALRPDLGLFVLDTALRLSDKILTMLLDEIAGRRGQSPPAPTRIGPELWSVTPHLYAVNGRRDLMANIGRANSPWASRAGP